MSNRERVLDAVNRCAARARVSVDTLHGMTGVSRDFIIWVLRMEGWVPSKDQYYGVGGTTSSVIGYCRGHHSGMSYYGNGVTGKIMYTVLV